MKRIYSIVILMVWCTALSVIAQNKTLQFICQNSSFADSLECRLSFGLVTTDTSYIYPATYNANKTVCYFTFPDSAYQKFAKCNITRKAKKYLYLRLKEGKDSTLYMDNALIWENVDTLRLYLKFERNSNTFGSKTSCYTLLNPTREIKLHIRGIQHDWVEARHAGAEEMFAYYKKRVSDYPDSRSVLQAVCGHYRLFTTAQLVELRDLFSPGLLTTYWGNMLQMLTSFERFPNAVFTNSRTGGKESVVIQPHKYTFVIFSASWCAPCHKLIPTYKKIYEAQQDMIDFVYFSLDEAQTQERWKQLLEKEGITWRSLFTDNVAKTRNFYKVPVIPYSFLVYPDGSYKKIDVRKEEDVKLLMDLKL